MFSFSFPLFVLKNNYFYGEKKQKKSRIKAFVGIAKGSLVDNYTHTHTHTHTHIHTHGILGNTSPILSGYIKVELRGARCWLFSLLQPTF
jgi:hypothetical protein